MLILVRSQSRFCERFFRTAASADSTWSVNLCIVLATRANHRSGARARKKLMVSSEYPPLVMPLSQSCKEKLQLQPSSAALLLPSEGGRQPEKKPLHL